MTQNENKVSPQTNLLGQGFAWFTVALAVFIILWGAWVRISHSGDGCGTHWPLCHNEFIPSTPSEKTWTEWFHRASSGVFGLLVLGLTVWGWRVRLAQPGFSWWTRWSLVFTISEALLGALLVKWQLVAGNTEPMRVLIMGAHLTNSMLLVLSLTKVALELHYPSQLQVMETWIEPGWDRLFFWGLPVFVFIVAWGGPLAALSRLVDSAHQGVLEGLRADFSTNSHYLIRLRWLHPALGLIVTSFFIIFGWEWSEKLKSSYRGLWRGLFAVLGGVSLVGISLILLKSWVGLKLLHILLVYLLWIYFWSIHHISRYGHASKKIS